MNILVFLTLTATAHAQFSGGFISSPTPSSPRPSQPAQQPPPPPVPQQQPQQPVRVQPQPQQQQRPQTPPPVQQQPAPQVQQPPPPPEKIGDKYLCSDNKVTDSTATASEIVKSELGMDLSQEGAYLLENAPFKGSRSSLTLQRRRRLSLLYSGQLDAQITAYICKVSDGVVRVQGTGQALLFGNPVGPSKSFALSLRKITAKAVRVEGLGEYNNNYSLITQ